MVGIYALGGVSSANFNPAVATALLPAGTNEAATFGAYRVTQIVSGCVAALCYAAVFGAIFNLGPTKGYGW